MAVKPQSLENPERGLNLDAREPAPKEERKRDAAADSARRRLQELLDQARELRPVARHWFDCWCQGRDAALAAVERAAGDVTEARAIAAPAVIGCGDCFRKGRDAVVRLFEGAC
jgi:hypothetical protein